MGRGQAAAHRGHRSAAAHMLGFSRPQSYTQGKRRRWGLAPPNLARLFGGRLAGGIVQVPTGTIGAQFRPTGCRRRWVRSALAALVGGRKFCARRVLGGAVAFVVFRSFPLGRNRRGPTSSHPWSGPSIPNSFRATSSRPSLGRLRGVGFLAALYRPRIWRQSHRTVRGLNRLVHNRFECRACNQMSVML